MKRIAGVDEAGRGPLAGPVVAAAVILDPLKPIAGLADSKKLTARARERLYERIQADALSWSIAIATVEEIDRLNILRASLLAMQRAVETLAIPPTEVWVDGNHTPTIAYPVTALIRGDSLMAEISAASILAKVSRDRDMVLLDAQYPGYGFAIHKGYPTQMHRDALVSLGVTAVHRRSYAPVRRLLA